MKYAIKTTRYDMYANYGDYIQQKSIENLYEYMGIDLNDVVKIDERELIEYKGDEYLIVPINAPFWGRSTRISDKIIPVYLGLALTNNHSDIIEGLRLKENEPIGCRDQKTYELVTQKGIKAYLNGCMTMTLPRRKETIVGDKVFVIDCCDELFNIIPKQLLENAIFLNQVNDDTKEVNESDCKLRYDKIKNEAKLVITSRLHIASPSIAFGIPTIFAGYYIPNRCVWMQKYIHLYDIEDFDRIDWSPKAINNEEIKQLLLENAKKQLLRVWEENYYRCSITELYYDSSFNRGKTDDMENAIEWLKNNWNSTDAKYCYILWGGTQTIDNVNDYIRKHYQYAKLIGVIDEFNDIIVDGVKSKKKEFLKTVDDDVVVFITAERASISAARYMDSIGHNNYCVCWANKNWIKR